MKSQNRKIKVIRATRKANYLKKWLRLTHLFQKINHWMAQRNHRVVSSFWTELRLKVASTKSRVHHATLLKDKVLDYLRSNAKRRKELKKKRNKTALKRIKCLKLQVLKRMYLIYQKKTEKRTQALA